MSKISGDCLACKTRVANLNLWYQTSKDCKFVWHVCLSLLPCTGNEYLVLQCDQAHLISFHRVLERGAGKSLLFHHFRCWNCAENIQLIAHSFSPWWLGELLKLPWPLDLTIAHKRIAFTNIWWICILISSLLQMYGCRDQMHRKNVRLFKHGQFFLKPSRKSIEMEAS